MKTSHSSTVPHQNQIFCLLGHQMTKCIFIFLSGESLVFINEFTVLQKKLCMSCLYWELCGNLLSPLFLRHSQSSLQRELTVKVHFVKGFAELTNVPMNQDGVISVSFCRITNTSYCFNVAKYLQFSMARCSDFFVHHCA